MDTFKITQLKHKILEYLVNNPPHHFDMELMCDDLKLPDPPLELFRAYLKEMNDDDTILIEPYKGGAVKAIKDRDRRLHSEGGYLVDYLKKYVAEIESDVRDLQKGAKLQMEIKNLYNRLKD